MSENNVFRGDLAFPRQCSQCRSDWGDKGLCNGALLVVVSSEISSNGRSFREGPNLGLSFWGVESKFVCTYIRSIQLQGQA